MCRFSMSASFSDQAGCPICFWPQNQETCSVSVPAVFSCVWLIRAVSTYTAKKEEVKRAWLVVNADGKPLGRLASEVAKRLRGKHKPQYTPHIDTGDHVIVVNAGKVAVTGNKRENKIYYRHSGYVGNLKKTSLKDMLGSHPERVIEIAVKGMLPKNPLGRQMFRKLRVYAGAAHGHEAQKPEALQI